MNIRRLGPHVRRARWSLAIGVPLVAGLAACAPPTGSAGSGGHAAASGGAPGSGAAPGSGGTSSASGGAPGSGGAGSGGAPGSGGASSGGGPGSGGASSGGGGGPVGSGGMAGGVGGSGSGGSVNSSACPAGSPTAAAGGAAFPFPQHRFGAGCIYPSTCNDADMSAGWKAFKTLLVVDDADGAKRVQRPENSNDSVSEGLGYGMLFAVYMNEKDTFDAFWKYVQKHLDSTGLMNWHIDSSGSTSGGGSNSATDSDEDMGFALVMADKQWGGYSAVAKSFLQLVVKNDFESDGTVKGGDQYANAVNPSYLAPAYYRTFGKYTGDAQWMKILDKSYVILAAATSSSNGLVPDWSAPAGRGPDYKYDAARTPFRIALDACWNDEPRAVTFSQGIAKFFAAIGAMNIKDGYSVSTGMSIGPNTNATFIGPAGVAGMAAKQTELVSDAYTFVAGVANKGMDSYYNLSWALFSTLMMTGNFVDMTAL
jgi:endo-1,4-beta-D-glucanase Y